VFWGNKESIKSVSEYRCEEQTWTSEEETKRNVKTLQYEKFHGLSFPKNEVLWRSDHK
jgi:hypothetical protein